MAVRQSLTWEVQGEPCVVGRWLPIPLSLCEGVAVRPPVSVWLGVAVCPPFLYGDVVSVPLSLCHQLWCLSPVAAWGCGISPLVIVSWGVDVYLHVLVWGCRCPSLFYYVGAWLWFYWFSGVWITLTQSLSVSTVLTLTLTLRPPLSPTWHLGGAELHKQLIASVRC